MERDKQTLNEANEKRKIKRVFQRPRSKFQANFYLAPRGGFFKRKKQRKKITKKRKRKESNKKNSNLLNSPPVGV